MSERGLVHVYYGDGKGKTTAALGLAVRAAGCRKNVVVVQFLKGRKSGEHDSFSHIPNIVLILAKPASAKFVNDMNGDELKATKASQDDGLKKALEYVDAGKCDVLVLDEIMDAYKLGIIDGELVKEVLRNKPDSPEIIITGHSPEEWFLARADYITEMKKHKHPYDEGVDARKGIEF